MTAESVSIEGAGEAAALPGLLTVPERPRALYLLAHGAGAGMRHAFMESLSAALYAERIAVLRWEFPWMAAGGRRPDRPAVAVPAVRRAVDAARALNAGRGLDLPLFVGGKSFGGRMTSTAESEEALPGVSGLVFVGFPLHPAGKPDVRRAEHLAEVTRPMLFMQGTRDKLAELDLMRAVVDDLGPGATLHLEDDADHGFHVRKRSGRDDEQVVRSLAETAARWMVDRDRPGD